MTPLIIAVSLNLAGAAAALVFYKKPALANRAGAAGAAAAGLLGLFTVLWFLLNPAPRAMAASWSLPYASLNMGADALTCFFLLPVFGIGALAAFHGFGFLEKDRAAQPGAAWFFFNFMAAGMALVPLARNGVFFLFAWELMSIASFFLVAMGERGEKHKGAARVYFFAAHTGAAFLFGALIWLARGQGTADFAAMQGAGGGAAAALFAFFAIGFGAKAGFAGLHIWMPRAYPSAPPFAAALMAGGMGNLGIYGLLRFTPMLGAPQPWMGWTLVAIGAASGVLGALYALAQDDIRRLFAYSSVEHQGIITMGAGFALTGAALGRPGMAALGMAGLLFHMLSHAFVKSLLFMQAGAVTMACGTASLERMGGLYKKLPFTGSLLLFGAAAICGLPPLAGFIGEFAVFLAAFKGFGVKEAGLVLPAVAGVTAIALIGGLAGAAFAKMFGIGFLGAAREAFDKKPAEPGPFMRWPGVAVAVVVALAGLYAPYAVMLLKGSLAEAAAGVTAIARHRMEAEILDALRPLLGVAQVFIALVAATAFAAGVRLWLLRGRGSARNVSWDCGYAAPGPRMQYSGWSFAAPLLELFGGLRLFRKRDSLDGDFFPAAGEFEARVAEPAVELGYAPAYFRMNRAMGRIRRLLHGGVHYFVVNIVLALLALLLIWKFLL